MTIVTDTLSETKEVDIIEELVTKVKQDPDFEKLLETSLRIANDVAVLNLEPDLYNVLVWPTTFEAYVDYLEGFRRLIPHQSGHKGWLDPRTEDYKEPLDRLCHFYLLIDQPCGDNKIVEDVPWFSEWLSRFAQAWGHYLDTTESFNEDVLKSFRDNAPKYRVEDSMIGEPPRPNAPSGWQTFNQFFARELNPGLRPIAEPADNTVVTCPADCTYREDFPINASSEIQEILVKGTHKFADVRDLLEGSQYRDAFANGHFVHYFLGPYSYHRFHTPVAGRVEECFKIDGKVFLNVVVGDGQFDAPDLAAGGYEFIQERGVITIDTTGSPFGDVGVVAVIPIGMAQVSGVNMIYSPGTECLKGDEFGYFTFGGSDIIVLFQEGTNPWLQKGGYYRHYGTAIARCTLLSG